MKTKKITISIIRPGGNDTALLAGIPMKSLRKPINDLVMKKFPSVEQVGFYKYSAKQNTARLAMAGGEFCGNATRSLAYLLLEGKIGSINIRVSGTEKLLFGGVKKQNTAFAQMPLRRATRQIDKISDYSIVKLDGITQVVVEQFEKAMSENELKTLAMSILRELNLLASVKASGVMFLEANKNVYSVKPVVWVRDIQTLFYETACASGTTAAGIYLADKNNRLTGNFTVKQPSGMNIKISFKRGKDNYLNAFIDGPISLLTQEEITIQL